MRALALAVTGLAATSTATRSDKKANLRNGRRKLSESIDLHKLEHDALVGGLGSKIFFKVSADPSSSKRRIKTLARGVAKDLDCESSEATRVFRPAGKHEADHAASGLNLWYQVDCSSKDVTLVEGDKARKIATSKNTLSAMQLNTSWDCPMSQKRWDSKCPSHSRLKLTIKLQLSLPREVLRKPR